MLYNDGATCTTKLTKGNTGNKVVYNIHEEASGPVQI